MVRVHIRKDSRERLSSFLATGHAGWADSGEDVVCAAVSTMLQTAWLGLSEIAKIDVRGSRGNGRLELKWPPERRDDPGVLAIVATAALAVERIAMQYPDHVGVVYERDDG
ncbi:MAG: ribosomal-processing cysteine protease Prp [Candidatus Eremiobacteraeota bacterium]|nr:ribosomal-processing cysteine protease Prp [Candidatus Eremiobacteraeota bacterium]